MSRHIDINRPQNRSATVLAHGLSGAGKTHWAATWPRPRFLADVVEGGFETLYQMDRSLWWEPNWTPQVRGIETYKDYQEELRLAEEDVKKGGLSAPQTIVFDSKTFLMQLMENYYRDAYPEQVQKNQYAVFNWMLKTSMSFVARMHKMSVNIVWLALTKDKEDTHGVCGPLLTGQIAQRMPAACKYILFLREVPSAQGKEPRYEVRTRSFGRYQARVRGKLPDPMEPTYRAFAQAAGLLKTATPARPAPVAAQR